ncbi:MAG: hypothetical protein NXI10_03540 [bacterium]|nr:hypothetical protein [bacterium]
MMFALTPTYADIFEDSPARFNNLIENIHIDLIIKVVSNTNAQLFTAQFEERIQRKLLAQWIHDLEPIDQLKIAQAFNQFVQRRGKRFGLFSSHYLLAFLHACLVQHESESDSDQIKSLEPEAILDLFKAYLIFTEELNDQIEFRDLSVEHFYERTWPLLIKQTEMNRTTNYFSVMLKSMCFFDYFQFELDKEEYVNNFIQLNGCEDGKNYAFRNIKLIQDGTNTGNENNYRECFFRSQQEFLPMYDNMSIDLTTYPIEFQKSKNLTGIRKTPLYKASEDQYCVIDWNLFSRKIYDGLIFDFYHRSGIKNEQMKNDFVNHYLPLVSEMIEKHLFRNLIRSIFERTPSAQIIFDDGEVNGAPDAYVRIGKRIFLFEIKDSYFSANAIESGDYKSLKNEIDRKYNNYKKGTGQIVNQLKFLKENSYEEKTFSQLQLKHRNIMVYPIILYTDPTYRLLGSESYLNKEFCEKLQKEKLDSTYGLVRRLSFISIDFFLENLMQLKEPKSRLDKLVDHYEKTIKARRKKFAREETMTSHFAMYAHFEDIVLGDELFAKDDGYIKQVFNDLNLMRGFAIS